MMRAAGGAGQNGTGRRDGTERQDGTERKDGTGRQNGAGQQAKCPGHAPKIKLCGLSRPQDILAANALMPDYIGFVFAPKSHRYVTPERAAGLRALLAPGILAVGVFVDAAPEDVAALLNAGLIDAAQLHGHEDGAYIRRLRALTKAPLIQAFRMDGEGDVRAAEANGADLIELGIPFSDPTAEGPVIQGANIRALKGGVTTDKIFAFVRELRRDMDVPMVFMTYANVVFSYGAEKFISACRDIGIDGLILPDLPFEEKEEFLPLCRQYGVDLISLIAPTSENRIAMIAKEAEGFLYIVSSLGVTGTRSEITTDLDSIVRVVRQNTDIPCAIGFGISTPEQAGKMARIADGVIVGSAIVKLLEKYGKEAPRYVGEYVRAMTEGMQG